MKIQNMRTSKSAPDKEKPLSMQGGKKERHRYKMKDAFPYK